MIDDMKTCIRCEILKPLSAFRTDRRNGKSIGKCRACESAAEVQRGRRKTMIPQVISRDFREESGEVGLLLAVVKQAFLDSPDDLGARVWIENIRERIAA